MRARPAGPPHARRPVLSPGRLIAPLAAAVLAAALAACQSSAGRPAPDPPAFADRPPLVFELARIEVVAPPAAPAAGAGRPAPVPLAAALEAWAAERLRAEGSAGLLRLTVHEARATVSALPTDEGLEGLFTREQAERLDLRLAATVEIVDAAGAVLGHAAADVRRSRTLPEGLTLEERERIYRETADALLADYDAHQEGSVRRYLGAWLRNGAGPGAGGGS